MEQGQINLDEYKFCKLGINELMILQKAEESLRKEAQKNVVLIAYEKD